MRAPLSPRNERDRDLIDKSPFSIRYYRGAVAALVVYDIQSKPSFEACERWISELRQNCDNKDLAVILVGNKVDQKHLREVPRDEAERFSVQQESMWLETSAADGTGVEEAFVELVRNALSKKGAVNTDTATSAPVDAIGKRRDDSVIRLEKFEPVTIKVSGESDTVQLSGGCSC
jgi:GTPase SAR1 family protein